MITNTCTIEKDGIGNTEIHCNEKLTGTLEGLGNIYFKGYPEIEITDTGIGEVIDSN